jgi:hypothetical protein
MMTHSVPAHTCIDREHLACEACDLGNLTNAQILHVFVEIMNGRNNHDSFLRAFADAVSRADDSNFQVVRPAALALISKYNLDQYLDNFRSAS